jgi:D-alanyl-D-alanine carboxypeptidase (penicillin-binding protein 5/6)
MIHKKDSLYTGIKTGITSTAGPCLASCIETACKRKFIIIVLGCKNMKSRYIDT